MKGLNSGEAAISAGKISLKVVIKELPPLLLLIRAVSAPAFRMELEA